MAIKGLEKFLKKKTETDSTSSGGVVISPTKGDGRGNDAHLPKGAPDGKGGEFASKDEVIAAQAEAETAEKHVALDQEQLNKIKSIFVKAVTNEQHLRESSPTRQNLIAHRKNLVNRMIRNSSISQESIDYYSQEIAPLLKEMVNNSVVTCNATPEGTRKILQSGLYLNQFGSKTSRGCYSFETRFRASRNMFGHTLPDYTGNKGKSLEKYGCLRSKNLKLNVQNCGLSAAAAQYNGDTGICFVLKRSQMPLVTMTSGDSLSGGCNSSIAPQLLNMPYDIFSTYSTYKSVSGLQDYAGKIKSNIREPEKIGDGWGGYFECQIHMSELPISSFSCLLIPNFSVERYGDIIKLAHEKNIKVIGGKYSERNDVNRKFYEFNVDSSGNIYDTIYDKEDIEDED